MAKNYVSEGDVLDFTNSTGATIASGTAVLIGKRIGVAVADIADAATGALAVEGVFSIAKLSTDVVAQGDLLYWDDTNKRLTTTDTGNTLAGFAAAAAGNGAAIVDIKINE